MPAILNNTDILVIALSDWDSPRRIRQYLTEECIRRGNRVLFVEGGYTWTKFFRSGNIKRLFRFLHGVRQEQPGLFVLAVPPFIPGGEFSSALSRLNWFAARVFIRRGLRKIGMQRPVLWIYAYTASTLVGRFDESFSLYLCNDAFANLYDSRVLQNRVRIVERRLLEKVDLVVTVSEKLTEEKRPYARRIGTIHHGVDIRLFEETINRGDDLPADMTAIPHPVIGYAGVIRYILDLDLVEYIAAAHPDWSIVLVGNIGESSRAFYKKIDALRTRSNIYFPGPKQSAEIPAYLRTFDVCMLPYTHSDVSSYYAVPLKFYEYLAAGKPVVWSLGPHAFPSPVLQNADTPQKFVSAIERALSTDTEKLREERTAIARQNSWGNRVERIAGMISGDAEKPCGIVP